jgi:hypothetical protein
LRLRILEDVALLGPPGQVTMPPRIPSRTTTMKLMKFIRRDAPQVAPFAREEQAGYMVRAAAEQLADESPDARVKDDYREVSRRLGHALRSHIGSARAILDASPLVRDADGVARPMVALVCGHEEAPDMGVHSAIRYFRTADWAPAT